MNSFIIAAKFAWQALQKQKLRTVLTVLTISIGIAAVIMVFAAGDGLNGMVMGQLKSFGTDIIQLEVKVPSTKQSSSENSQGQALGITITTFKNKDVEALRKIKNISHIYGAVMGQELVTYLDVAKKVFLMGVGYEAPAVNNTGMALGREISKDEEESLSQVAVLGYKTWQDFFGDENPVGKMIKIGPKKFRVVGVMQERGAAFFMNLDEQIYIPVTTMQKRLLGTDYISFAVAKMRDASKSVSTKAEIEAVMREQHDIIDPDKDDFAVSTMDEAMTMLSTIIGSITILLVAIVCISLLVGGIGIMNIMYVSVAERTFEIGLRKALGATSRDILRQFLSEAVIITVAGGIVGIILGAIFAYVVTIIARNYGLAWVYHVSLSSIIMAFSFSAFVGLIFGIYPAKRAAKLDPITALRKTE
ncbi:MAG TPA: ABC transporter permease [Candidatus Magasanikbacteria bacterium]|nr:ABC transporter permease [Candidatus Magasanikbacteria bacterium]